MDIFIIILLSALILIGVLFWLMGVIIFLNAVEDVKQDTYFNQFKREKNK